MGQKLVVGPLSKGLRNDVTAFNIDNESFPTLINAYQWRLRCKRKRGTSPFTRLQRQFIELIKSGKFKFPSDITKIEKLIFSYMNFLSFCKQKRVTPLSMFTNSHFTIAYRNLVLLQQFNESVFMTKLEMRWFDLKPQLNSKEWTKQLINIYNWKNQNPIDVAYA